MITKINESKTLTKHVWCECICNFDSRKCNLNQKWNNDKCRCECKKHNICKKDYIWNPAACSCENGKYLAVIMGDSVLTCDEIVGADADVEAKSYNEETKTIDNKFQWKKSSLQNTKFLYFTCIFINNYSIMDSC